MRTVVWVSAGAASAVAAKLTPDAVLAYCETGSEHPDNARFLDDVSAWCGRPVERLKSDKYASTWDVFEQRRYLAGVGGALCTTELKVFPRLAWQCDDDAHVFGYTADANDQKRATRLRLNYPGMAIKTPLIDAGVTKEACLAMIERAGIQLPPMYAMGFQNNNCIPCVKATSPPYRLRCRSSMPRSPYDRRPTVSRGNKACVIVAFLGGIDASLCALLGVPWWALWACVLAPAVLDAFFREAHGDKLT